MQNNEPTATVLLGEQKCRIYESCSWISPEQARRVSCDEPFPWLGVVNKSAVTIVEAEPRGLIGPVVFLARVSEFRYLQMASVWIDGERIISLPITEYIQSIAANLQTQKEAFSFVGCLIRTLSCARTSCCLGPRPPFIHLLAHPPLWPARPRFLWGSKFRPLRRSKASPLIRDANVASVSSRAMV